MTNSATNPGRVPARRTPPVSIRFTQEQRSLLHYRAGSLPLGTYIKSVLFAKDAPSYRASPKRVTLDQEVFGRALGFLGQSNLATNLSALAKAAEAGNIYVDEGTRGQLLQACADVCTMRGLLMQAMGKQVDAPASASRAFVLVSEDRT